MTTVTPSDRAGAASAKRPATIPTQRSRQALRLLVLGTGEDAAAFRARAAEAGAELAQRFSVRVTHVVIEEGIGEADARVVRARTAGLPVLRLTEGDRLIEEGTSEVGEAGEAEEARGDDADAVEGGEGDGERATGEVRTYEGVSTSTSGGTDGADGGAYGDGTETGGAEGDGDSADADGLEDEAGTYEHASAVALVRPRAEPVPETVDGGPSDVFASSAFEAMLQFPPLPADEHEVGAFDGEAPSTLALMNAASAACACGDAVMETTRTEAAGAEAGGSTWGATTAGMPVGEETSVEAEVVTATESGAAEVAAEADVAPGQTSESGPASESASAAELESAAESGALSATSRTAAWTASSVAWALVPFVSLGLLTPVAIGYAAYRLRSRNLAAATACYSLAVVAAFAVSAVVPARTGSHSVVGDLLTTCLAASWLGGTAHGFMIRRRVFES